MDGILGTGSLLRRRRRRAAASRRRRRVRVSASINAPHRRSAGAFSPRRDYYAYLKIAEGCDNHCAYCVIPSLRGKYRSRPMEALSERSERACRVRREGADRRRAGHQPLRAGPLRRAPSGGAAARSCAQIDGIVWIRVHYLYPDEMSDELIDVHRVTSRRSSSIWIFPSSTSTTAFCKKMNRRGERRVSRGSCLPSCARASPALCCARASSRGFPARARRSLRSCANFCGRRAWSASARSYSRRRRARAAAKMEYPPDGGRASTAPTLIAELQSRIMDDYNASRIGTSMQVLCEGYDEENEAYFGRTYADSPDIDGKIWFSSDRDVRAGAVRHRDASRSTCDGELIGDLEETDK